MVRNYWTINVISPKVFHDIFFHSGFYNKWTTIIWWYTWNINLNEFWASYIDISIKKYVCSTCSYNIELICIFRRLSIYKPCIIGWNSYRPTSLTCIINWWNWTSLLTQFKFQWCSNAILCRICKHIRQNRTVICISSKHSVINSHYRILKRSKDSFIILKVLNKIFWLNDVTYSNNNLAWRNIISS